MDFKKLLPVLLLILSCSCSQLSSSKNEKEKKAMIYYDHGTQLLMKQDYARALELLLKAEELSPQNGTIQNNLGMTYYFKNAYDQAINHFSKALQINPKNSDARNNLASTYLVMNQLSKAEAEYHKILNDLTYTNQFRTYYNLGVIKSKQGKRVEAQQMFHASVKEYDEYCPALFEIAKYEYDLLNYEKAVKEFKKASNGPCYNNPTPIYYHGLVLRKLGKQAEALEKFQDIIGRFPDSELAVNSKEQIKQMSVLSSLKEQEYLPKINNYDTSSSKQVFEKREITTIDSVQSPNF